MLKRVSGDPRGDPALEREGQAIAAFAFERAEAAGQFVGPLVRLNFCTRRPIPTSDV